MYNVIQLYSLKKWLMYVSLGLLLVLIHFDDDDNNNNPKRGREKHLDYMISRQWVGIKKRSLLLDNEVFNQNNTEPLEMHLLPLSLL